MTRWNLLVSRSVDGVWARTERCAPANLPVSVHRDGGDPGHRLVGWLPPAPPVCCSPPAAALTATPGAGAPPRNAATSSACAASSPSANGAVTASALTALHFTSATEGVALVAGGARHCPARMAVSHDGGATWKLSGSVLWASAPTTGDQVVGTSAQHAWASEADGPLVETQDGGRHWTSQPVPTPVEDLAIAGDTVWALSCPPRSAQTNTCAPVVEQQLMGGGAWRRLPLPASSTLLEPRLHLVTSTTAVIVATLAGVAPGSAGRLLVTTDSGRHWAAQLLPRGPINWCNADATAFAAGSATTWWLLCNGSAAAGSSQKALLRTTDAGGTWTTVAEVPDLQSPLPAGSLTAADTNDVSAASPTLLWLATADRLTESTDGGQRWQTVASVQFDGRGTEAVFDVYSPTRAWVLAARTALWSTTDGTTWRGLA